MVDMVLHVEIYCCRAHMKIPDQKLPWVHSTTNSIPNGQTQCKAPMRMIITILASADINNAPRAAGEDNTNTHTSRGLEWCLSSTA